MAGPMSKRGAFHPTTIRQNQHDHREARSSTRSPRSSHHVSVSERRETHVSASASNRSARTAGEGHQSERARSASNPPKKFTTDDRKSVDGIVRYEGRYFKDLVEDLRMARNLLNDLKVDRDMREAQKRRAICPQLQR